MRKSLGRGVAAGAELGLAQQQRGLDRVGLLGIEHEDFAEGLFGLAGRAGVDEDLGQERQHLGPLGLGERLVGQQAPPRPVPGVELFGDHRLDQLHAEVNPRPLRAKGLQHPGGEGLGRSQGQGLPPGCDRVVQLAKLIMGPPQKEVDLGVLGVGLGRFLGQIAGLGEVAGREGRLGLGERGLGVGLGHCGGCGGRDQGHQDEETKSRCTVLLLCEGSGRTGVSPVWTLSTGGTPVLLGTTGGTPVLLVGDLDGRSRKKFPGWRKMAGVAIVIQPPPPCVTVL